jgi:hypothetical protein
MNPPVDPAMLVGGPTRQHRGEMDRRPPQSWVRHVLTPDGLWLPEKRQEQVG